MPDVQLPIAKDMSDGTILHISDTPYKVLKDKVLVCPFCEGRVFKRAGSRQPHFYHKPKNDCDVSRETLLHEGAKYFIYDCLVRNIEFKIFVDTARLEHGPLRKLLETIRINSFSISSKSVMSQNDHWRHEVEKTLGSYRPDVLSRATADDKGLKRFAWEVYVTHELEEEKISHFIEDEIGFIEIVPQLAADLMDGYIFTLNRFKGFDLCLNDDVVLTQFHAAYDAQLFEMAKGRFEERIVNKAVDAKVADLEKTLRANIEDEHLSEKLKVETKVLRQQIEEEIGNSSRGEERRSICYDLRDLPVGFSVDITRFLTQRFSSSSEAVMFNNPAESKWEPAKIVSYHPGDKYNNVKINSKFNIISIFHLYRNIVLFLLSLGYCKPVFSEEGSRGRRQLVGYKLNAPNAIRGEVLCHEIITGGYSEDFSPENGVIDFELKKWKKLDKWIVIAKEYIDDDEGYIVRDIDSQTYRLLEFFILNYSVRFTTSKTRNNYYGVSEIEIKGLPDEIDLKEFIERKLNLSGPLPQMERFDRFI